MNEFLDIVKYTIPLLICGTFMFILVWSFLESDRKRRKVEIILQNQKIINPIRLQAYERLALFLERISPESLIMRLNKANMTSRQLQSEMVEVIRAEFEHNYSQQIYVSPEAWEMIKNAKSITIKLVNLAAGKVAPEASSIDFSRTLLEMIMEGTNSPSQQAIDFIKKEARELF
jgi:hypothetical protein